MAFRSFRTHTLVRVLLIVAVTTALVYLALNTDKYATILVLLAVFVLQIWNLFRYVDHSNRDVARLLEALRFGDLSQTFSTYEPEGSHRELKLALNDVMAEFGKARRAGEEKHRYLQTVVRHAGIGLMAVRTDGEIELSNTPACRMLGVQRLARLDKLPDSLADLVQAIKSIQSGERAVVKFMRDQRPVQLSVAAPEFRQDTREIKLLSIQDISQELAEQEMEAWQRLARVLAHEIMNSVTPISSLSTTARELLESALNDLSQSNDDTDRNLRDVLEAIVTIEKRSSGLVQFVLAYRDLTRIAKPNVKIVRVADLLARVNKLIGAREDASHVAVTTETIPEGLEITVDPTQIEQVLINLVLNSTQALTGQKDGAIQLSGRLGDAGRPIMEVIDNGPGIEPEAMDKLFVPFFSTKPGGTGIGLALSRQIMRLHKGEIGVTSKPGSETVFALRF